VHSKIMRYNTMVRAIEELEDQIKRKLRK
jgi:hypothetical protein